MSDPDTLYLIANAVALAGWLALFLSPLFYKTALLVAGLVIPLLLAVAYAILFWSYLGISDGSFLSLSGVVELFSHRKLVLVGWLHYLAFDLLVGSWETRTARAEAIPFMVLFPCLLLTYVFGPVGFLLFTFVRFIRSRRVDPLV